MESGVTGFVVALAGGVAIAAANACISRAAYFQNESRLTACFLVRQLLNVGYLVALYFLSDILPWDAVPLLLGGALGLTLPSFYFVRRMVARNDAEETTSAQNEQEPMGR